MTKLADKIAFITGASSGLGAATAELFIQQGAFVFGVGRNRQALAQMASNCDQFDFVVCDVAKPSQCRESIQACIDKFGRLDVLVNVAGQHTFRHLQDIKESEWQEDIAINLSGPFHLIQTALPHLLESNGNVVNVASIAAVQGQPYSAGYCAAKHGLVGLTRSLAMEFMKQDIRINAVCPGGMETPQVQRIQPPEDCDFDLLMRTAAPRGFMQAEQVAEVIAFLASDAASAIHGAVYEVDQGKTVG